MAVPTWRNTWETYEEQTFLTILEAAVFESKGLAFRSDEEAFVP